MALLAGDLDFLQRAMRPLLPDLKGAKVLITGGTGIFGSWLLEALTAARRAYKIDLSITVLSRNPDRFKALKPHLGNDPAVSFLQGDVRQFTAHDFRFDYIIHAAAESHNLTGSRLAMVDTIVDGTRRILDLSAATSPKSVLYVSSNAVYGRTPGGPAYIEETSSTGPLVTDADIEYDESKRMAEALCVLYSREYGVPIKIARCFPVVGPYLPLDAHFAVGNFILNALDGNAIVVNGDGTAERSYLYLADLAIWLLTILIQGASETAYNVGSDEAISTGDLARRVAACIDPTPQVQVKGIPIPGAPVSRYVPSIRRAGQELGLSPTYSLDQALKCTIEYYRRYRATG